MNYPETFWKAFDHKILVDYERAKQFVGCRGMPAPRFSNMYITSGCNQSCLYCEYAEENTRPVITPLERVLQNIDEVRELGVSAIDICGGGEPTLHPGLGRILEHCRERDIVVGLFTNLAVADPRLLETIVACCSYVKVSLDSFNEVTYRRLRRPRSSAASCGTAVANLGRLVELKRGSGSELIIGAKALLTRHNAREAEEFIRRSIELGVDNVQFKRVSLHERLLPAGPGGERGLAEQLAALAVKYAPRIAVLSRIVTPRLETRCFMHVNHIFIDAFGDVYLCCYYLRRKAEHHLGNVAETPIREIWYGARHREVAQRTRVEECNRMDCRWIGYNTLMKPFVHDDRLRQLDFV